MSDEHKAYVSTAAATLEAHIVSVHSAKSEAEWWAQREIGRLRAENEKLRGELREADAMLLKQARTIRELSNGRYGQ